MYRLWAERSPNQPTASFRAPADPNKEFWFQYTFRRPSTQVLSARTSRLPSVTLHNEPARGSTPENQDISWRLITLPWWEPRAGIVWGKIHMKQKTNPGNFLLVLHCLQLWSPSYKRRAARILQEFLPDSLRKHNTPVWNILTHLRTDTNALQHQNSSHTLQHNKTFQLLTWHRTLHVWTGKINPSMSVYQTTLESCQDP